MKEKINTFIVTIKEKWTPMQKGRKIAVIMIPLVIIVSAIVLTVILNRPTYSVLFRGVSSEEASEIVGVINKLNVTDVSIKSNGDIVVPEADEERLRFELNSQGYPSTGLNYDIWDNGVDLFSSDFEKREKQRQQLETRISATIKSFSKIKSAIVTLWIPEQANYVINQERTEPTASVTITTTGEKLNQDEINAIYHTVQKSTSQLKLENISVVDADRADLKYVGEGDEIEGSDVDVAYKRLEFKNDLEKILSSNLHNLFIPLFGDNGYSIAVNTVLDYDKELSEETIYTPSVDEKGMVQNEITEYGAEGTAVDGGLIGTTPNADGSPDYPTLEIDPDGDLYLQYKRELNYLVNTKKTQMQKDGYYIDSVTATLVVNQEDLSEDMKVELAMLVADGIGTSSDNVTVFGRRFANSELDGKDPSIYTKQANNLEDYLLFIAIGLAVILIALLILYLFIGGSKKKYKKKKTLEPAVATAGMVALSDVVEENKTVEPIPQPEEFQVASLSEANTGTSKEAILKREIGEFSRTNPEIVASLVRNLLHNDDY